MTKQVFADERWYIERPEPEEHFTGTLEPVKPPSGPAGRPALSYILRTGSGELSVYAVGIEELLGSFAGITVSIIGKCIDFTHDGFALELWIGEIKLES